MVNIKWDCPCTVQIWPWASQTTDEKSFVLEEYVFDNFNLSTSIVIDYIHSYMAWMQRKKIFSKHFRMLDMLKSLDKGQNTNFLWRAFQTYCCNEFFFG